MILCGGKGVRLREETEYRPKPLVAVGDRPIVWHIMKLYSHYGYNDFVLCLGYKGDMIKEYFSNSANREPAWNVVFADTGLECETGSRIARAKQYIGDDKEFLLTYGDGVADVDINKLVKHHRAMGKAVTVTSIMPPNPFGVLEINDQGLVTSFAEKHRSKDWTNGGFFVCNSSLFQYLDDGGSCIFEQGPVQKLAQEGQLAAYQHHDFWHCVDTLKHLEGLNTLYQRGERPWMVWEQS